MLIKRVDQSRCEPEGSELFERALAPSTRIPAAIKGTPRVCTPQKYPFGEFSLGKARQRHARKLHSWPHGNTFRLTLHGKLSHSQCPIVISLAAREEGNGFCQAKIFTPSGFVNVFGAISEVHDRRPPLNSS